jgi:hypothetical protein
VAAGRRGRCRLAGGWSDLRHARQSVTRRLAGRTSWLGRPGSRGVRRGLLPASLTGPAAGHGARRARKRRVRGRGRRVRPATSAPTARPSSC